MSHDFESRLAKVSVSFCCVGSPAHLPAAEQEIDVSDAVSAIFTVHPRLDDDSYV